MIQFDFIALILYSIGLLLWFPIWHYLVGFSLLKKMKLLYIAFWGAPFVFTKPLNLFYRDFPFHMQGIRDFQFLLSIEGCESFLKVQGVRWIYCIEI